MKYTAPRISRSYCRTRIFNSRITFIALAAFALLTLATTTAFMDAPVSGAIFTTDSSCSGVDLNIYTDKAAVFIDGGPTHPGAAGLPDGSYCVQVTEPFGGAVLGRSAPGAVIVSGGEFATCYQLSSILNTSSSGFTAPGYDDTSNPGGEYKVWVSTDCSFVEANSKTDNFKVKSQPCDPNDPNCVPQTNPTLRVRKYYDANANGINDDSQNINGWKIHIVDDIDFIRFTPVNIVLDIDTYTVTEFPTIETNWQHTGCSVINNLTSSSSACIPGPDSTSVTLDSGDDKTVEFGNLCLGAGGGMTLGFWSNKNGQALFGADDLALMVSLNLRNADGSDFNPASYAAFRTWLLNATAVNMAYMLSAQLAAMELNVLNGKVTGSSLIYAPGTTSANPLGYATVNAVMAEANTELGLHGYTRDGSQYRTYQEALKNALDKANNNQNFVQAGPCAFSFAP
jgi:hypothetical protein